jgi:hypothetical protein
MFPKGLFGDRNNALGKRSRWSKTENKATHGKRHKGAKSSSSADSNAPVNALQQPKNSPVKPVVNYTIASNDLFRDNADRLEQYMTYIDALCERSNEGYYSIQKVERLLLRPRPMADSSSQALRVIETFEKFEQLLQTASFNHFEWIEFTAGQLDGEFCRLSLKQFLGGVDRLCENLHLDKLSHNDLKQLFYVITHTSSHKSSLFDNLDGFSKVTKPRIQGSTSSTIRDRGDDDDKFFIDQCNLEFAFNKFHICVKDMKRFQPVVSQLLDISPFMRLFDIRLHEKETIWVSSTQLETLLTSLLQKFETHCGEFGLISSDSLPPIDQAEEDRNHDSNVMYFQKQSKPQPKKKKFSLRGSISSMFTSLQSRNKLSFDLTSSFASSNETYSSSLGASTEDNTKSDLLVDTISQSISTSTKSSFSLAQFRQSYAMKPRASLLVSSFLIEQVVHETDEEKDTYSHDGLGINTQPPTHTSQTPQFVPCATTGLEIGIDSDNAPTHHVSMCVKKLDSQQDDNSSRNSRSPSVEQRKLQKAKSNWTLMDWVGNWSSNRVLPTYE